MSRYGYWMKTLVAVGVLTFAMTAAHAQETTGSISGTVVDASGATIKGATVMLINMDRGHVERTLTTNSAGFYTATSLPLGAYLVKIVDHGFKTEEVTGIELHVNDALTVNRTLAAGNEGEVVTVTADQVQCHFRRIDQLDADQSTGIEHS